VNLIFRSSLPLKQSESYMSECSRMWRATRKVFSLHKSVVSCGCAERNSVASIVSAHTDEIGAPGNSTFEMVDV
jgi:hypothetical protein